MIYRVLLKKMKLFFLLTVVLFLPIHMYTMSYKQFLATQLNSSYNCCVGCIRSNGTRPFYSCSRTYQANYISSDEEEENDNDNEENEDELPPMPPPIQRQTTQWIVNGQVIFNGNPNGDRFLNVTNNEITN